MQYEKRFGLLKKTFRALDDKKIVAGKIKSSVYVLV